MMQNVALNEVLTFGLGGWFLDFERRLFTSMWQHENYCLLFLRAKVSSKNFSDSDYHSS